MKRDEILANREKWISFLEVPSRRKTKDSLDNGDGKRCCLGHACYVLNIKKEVRGSTIYYGSESSLAPGSVMDLLGLYNNDGKPENDIEINVNGIEYHSLAEANDGLFVYNGAIKKGQSPQNIAKYLRSVIEGGVNTPFRPLKDYDE